MPKHLLAVDRLNHFQLLGHLLCLSPLQLGCLVLSLASAAQAQQVAPSSPKRGLISIQGVNDGQFDSAPSDLTWYYNYASTPTSSISSSELSFVPQLFGATTEDPGTGFASTVESLGSQYALAFNEPDGCDNGGSCVSADLAAQVWQSELAPLQQKGVKVGSPATTGSQRGLAWMRSFFAACDGGCKPDFLAVHWYGDFQGLASWLGQVNATFGNYTTGGMWVTEFAYPNTNLSATQSMYNESTEYFDRLDFVGRYSYFGAFRSDVSNVGPNVAMLDSDGDLTDIGAWYLGRAATGNIPSSGEHLAPSKAIAAVCAIGLILSSRWL